MVHQDNHGFLFERQVFNIGFFEAIKELASIMLANNPEVLEQSHPNSEPIFAFMEKMVFEILPSLSDNKHLLEMASLHRQMLQSNQA